MHCGNNSMQNNLDSQIVFWYSEQSLILHGLFLAGVLCPISLHSLDSYQCLILHLLPLLPISRAKHSSSGKSARKFFFLELDGWLGTPICSRIPLEGNVVLCESVQVQLISCQKERGEEKNPHTRAGELVDFHTLRPGSLIMVIGSIWS